MPLCNAIMQCNSNPIHFWLKWFTFFQLSDLAAKHTNLSCACKSPNKPQYTHTHTHTDTHTHKYTHSPPPHTPTHTRTRTHTQAKNNNTIFTHGERTTTMLISTVY